MSKLAAILAVFRKGVAVTDPAAWKNWQMLLNLLVGLVVSAAILAETMGWIPQGVTNEISDIVVKVLVAVAGANIAGTAVTSEKVGLGRKPAVPDELRESSDALPPRVDRDVSGRPTGATRTKAERGRDAWLGD